MDVLHVKKGIFGSREGVRLVSLDSLGVLSAVIRLPAQNALITGFKLTQLQINVPVR